MSTAQRFVLRVRVVAALVGLVALVIVGKLYVLQILHGGEYARQADAQAVELLNPLLNRGNIYFTAKDGALVTAATLRDVSASATTSTSTVDEGKQRYYPGGQLAAQTIGFVSYGTSDTQSGQYGLERYYDDVLSRPGDDLYANFFVQLFGAAKSLGGGEEQGDLITTIEPTVEVELENTLKSYNDQWHPALSGGIIMDPKTGEIVAMAVSPTFDLNSFNTQTDPSIYNNPMNESVFEMGSIIKPLTMAAGLDSGAITAEETYNDTGCITENGAQICNFDLKARGTIPMQQILSQSLNVGASFIANQMGPATMRDYFLNHYKMGEETGIDLPGELHGLVNNLNAPANETVDYDTASFGQGIALTPVETVRALATLANGGYLVTPHVGKAIREDTGVVRTLGWGPPVQVLKPQTATDVSRMLTTVVDTAFTKGMSFQHYSVAAKTGTAQVVDPTTGKYFPDLYLHSYFGYFPSYDAKFIIFLFANKPVGAPYSSETWGGYFHSLVQFLINYYNVAPDR